MKAQARPRPTKEQVDARVNDLLRVMLDGARSWDIPEYVRQQEQEQGSPWQPTEGQEPLSYSQIRRYAKKAEALIVKDCKANRQKLLNRHLAQRRSLYAKAVSQGDCRAALVILDSEAKLLALFPETEETRGRKPAQATITLNVIEQLVLAPQAPALPPPMEMEVINGIVSNGHAEDRQASPCPASLSQV